MTSTECTTLYGQAGNTATYIHPITLSPNVETLFNEDELATHYEAVMAPIVSEDFNRAFAQNRYACHVSALNSSNISDANIHRVKNDIATLKDVSAKLQEKLRVLPHYLRSQNAVLAELQSKAEFTGSASHVDMTDSVSRATTGFLQWPLTESMTTPMVSIATGFGMLTLGIIGYGASLFYTK